MNKLTKTPATVRELGDMAAAQGIAPSELLATLTIPTPPRGYILAEGCSDFWIGPEVVNARWIITPAWHATTNTHSFELWMADDQPLSYANLSPAEALQLAADLAAAAGPQA